MTDDLRKLAEAATNAKPHDDWPNAMDDFRLATNPLSITALLNAHEAEVKALTDRVAELESQQDWIFDTLFELKDFRHFVRTQSIKLRP